PLPRPADSYPTVPLRLPLNRLRGHHEVPLHLLCLLLRVLSRLLDKLLPALCLKIQGDRGRHVPDLSHRLCQSGVDLLRGLVEGGDESLYGLAHLSENLEGSAHVRDDVSDVVYALEPEAHLCVSGLVV